MAHSRYRIGSEGPEYGSYRQRRAHGSGGMMGISGAKRGWAPSRRARIVLGRVVAVFSLIFCLEGHIDAQESSREMPRGIAPNPRVLVLHSYHYGFTWSQNVSRGIELVFKRFSPRTELVTEYMDVKRIDSPGYFQMLRKLYEVKYPDGTIDVIIAVDERALAFLLTTGKDLLPGVPVVFCGVNEYDPSKFPAHDREVTGVIEDIDIKASLDIALKLHPNTTEIAYVSDASATGMTVKVLAEKVFSTYGDSLSFRFIPHRTMAKLQDDVSHLPETSILFAFIFSEDEYGRIWSHEYNLERLASVAEVPIYSVWEFYLGHGIVGGKLTSGTEHGKLAGNMAFRILQGESANLIPIVQKSPNRFMFDYEYLQEYGVSESSLPQNSIVVNKPMTIYEQYTLVVWGAILAFGLLVMLIILLALNVVLRRRSQIALKRSEEQFRTFMDRIPGLTFIKDEHGVFLFANQNFLPLLGVDPNVAVGKKDSDIFPPDFAREIMTEDQRVLRSGQSEELENVFKGRIWMTRKFLVPTGEKENILGGVTLDVTERKAAEQGLKASLHEKETLLRELYHRTKNNMQVISAFLELQAASSEDSTAERIISDGVTRIRTMALAHEKLYKAKSLSRIGLKDYIVDLVQLLSSTYTGYQERIRVHFEMEQIDALIDIAIPCGLVVNELVSNSFKHAFPGERNGDIWIGLRRIEAGHLELSVRDNGIGAPDDFRIERSTTLGMQIVHQIVRHQLKGDLSVETKGGFWWRIAFRDNLYRERV